jgi:hypothetical protein
MAGWRGDTNVSLLFDQTHGRDARATWHGRPAHVWERSKAKRRWSDQGCCCSRKRVEGFRNSLPGNPGAVARRRRLAARHLGPGRANGCPNKKRHGKIWFTTETAHPSFGGDSNHEPPPVSHDPSRKKFLARLLGIVAGSSLLPKMFAKASPASALAPSPAKNSEFQLRPAPRTVARRPHSL